MHTGAHFTIPLDHDGKHIGQIELPYSVDRSPFYRIQLPVCHIQNGDGPAVLLMAGVHGDEYEGKLALTQLIRELQPQRIKGQVTILPLANGPAVHNASRCSPYDGGNLNRCFPGNPIAGPTSRIAHMIENELMVGKDYVFDLHSGGTSMAHLCCTLCEVGYGDVHDQRARSLLSAMGMPFALTADNGRDSPTSLAAANRVGCVAVSGEFGGGGSTSREKIDTTLAVLDRFMMAVGLTDAPVFEEISSAQDTVFIEQSGPEGMLLVAKHGWFEPMFDIGDDVKVGQLAGRIVDFMSPVHEPSELFFQCDGVITSRRLHTHVQPGDCLYTVARRS